MLQKTAQAGHPPEPLLLHLAGPGGVEAVRPLAPGVALGAARPGLPAGGLALLRLHQLLEQVRRAPRPPLGLTPPGGNRYRAQESGIFMVQQ